MRIIMLNVYQLHATFKSYSKLERRKRNLWSTLLMIDECYLLIEHVCSFACFIL